MTTFTICITQTEYAYRLTVVDPEGLTTSATRDTRQECLDIAVDTMDRFAREKARGDK